MITDQSQATRKITCVGPRTQGGDMLQKISMSIDYIPVSGLGYGAKGHLIKLS